MRTTKGTTGAGTGRKASMKSPRQQAAANRDYAGNARKSGAPFGRYEDKSAKTASTASKKAITRAAAEGPKKTSPVKKRGR